jgi:hypothetical protein
MRPLASAWLAVLLCLVISGCQTSRPPAGTPAETPDMTAIEYSDDAFIALVKKYAGNDGKVDYQAWKDQPDDLGLLDRQVGMLAQISPENHPEQFPDRAAQRSYWINAYNTLVLHAVLEHWPLDSVQDVKISLTSRVVPGKGFFYDRKVVVGGRETNLYDLEKEVLRTQKDPRLHFAFNCASSSCPVLRPWEWTDEQLDQAARDFVNDPANVSVTDDTVYLSRIFKWYRKDFPEDQLAYVQQYADTELDSDLQQAREQRYRKRYLDYDWDLNESAAEAAPTSEP